MLTSQGHSGHTFYTLAQIMLEFSLIGSEFIDRFAPTTTENAYFKKLYNEDKDYHEKRQDATQKLVRVFKRIEEIK